MPLIVATLQAELIGVYEKGPTGNPSPQLVGLNTAKAYMNYCSTGMNAGAGSFTAMPQFFATTTSTFKKLVKDGEKAIA